ncbi:MAG: hypothetical protein ACW98K_04590 [Candidatus Kariarchaeaceae archaeon]|jgi:hypothetical protein
MVNSSILALSGIVAVIVLIYLMKAYLNEKKLYQYYWGLGFFMHFVFVILILTIDYEILEKPLSQYFASFIPIGIALGLYFAIWEDKNYGFYFLGYEFVATSLILLCCFDLVFAGQLDLLVTLAHAPCGISMTILPLYTALVGKTGISSVYYAFAGLFISVRGCIMTTFKLYDPLVSEFNEDFSHSILPMFFMIAGAFLILGISVPSKWRVDLPLIPIEKLAVGS